MIVIVFVFGLIVGSFLNAVIFRLHSSESIIRGRSHCVHCKHELSPMDLIPVVSFMILSGKCRYCHKKISWQYPLVELVTGLVFVLLALSSDFRLLTSEFWYLLTVICFLIIIAVFDFKHFLILDVVIYPALILATIYNLSTGFFVEGIIGALVISGFFAAQYFVSKGRWIGFGDVKLGLLLGSIFGLKLGLVMLLLAYFMGAIVGVGLLITGRKKLSSELPFGVFLSISAILIMLYGQDLADWYYNLLGL
ncbi:MAG: hypothetical protein A3I07_01335 [Candidatus Doudnabacteria bacterium RIFCSPLOWO2_02_FULL_42_9]|uniref:Prepilin peptidase n=1 Tax=Candidatus Doudnabacteria bacterium RIFCSPHIGHO2_01_FULL_41_86 TaxID=1817821 RepID=A0A1F5N901_9BACT|nr:MAG: hypothetical protein A2717_00895 [Candidatus Doudnabacteria bacterium RIFCSPHIGHO2_01_FULL_41_86]OGE75400.1 MAG: hypothetical protein A3K07_01410 [Candidatus Doudnabacteria bacterium RIFCSPHIGHO2_01_43_10]OGE86574.1 MAG: hypothetical protein A3E28_04160 [Candidatus Doudnabacteria bacterium RIFCSPHIGHO2_12_FULL_42_22]OGE87474.1 MAG: hypothetical protein A3C49_03820 [Candidatus Doudnabacteria bacterium RIFCSPHIGHO2_02_FULL_42_25]OGE92791.1 MAG: hypothetical protein A2895_04695 [Candidatus